MTDLTFIEDGNPDFRQQREKFINFDKYTKIAKTIKDLQRFQVPFSLFEVVEIQGFVQSQLTSANQSGLFKDQQDLYEVSCLLEPREHKSGGNLSRTQSQDDFGDDDVEQRLTALRKHGMI